MKAAVLGGCQYSRPAPCHLVTVGSGDSAGMKGRCIPAEVCNHVLSPVCLNHLPLPSGCTHFSTAGVMNSCPWSCQPHKLSTVCHRCHVTALGHQERKWEPDGTEEIRCGQKSTRWRFWGYLQPGRGEGLLPENPAAKKKVCTLNK